MKRNLQLIVCLLFGSYGFACGMEQPTVDQDFVNLVMSLDNRSSNIFHEIVQVNLDQKSKKILDESIKRHTSDRGKGRSIAFSEVQNELLDLKLHYSAFRKKAFIGLGLISAVNAALFGWYACNEDESMRLRLLDIACSVTNGASLFLFYKLLSTARTQSKNALGKFDKDSDEMVQFKQLISKEIENICIPSISDEVRKNIGQLFLISGATNYFSGSQSGIVAGLNVAAAAFTYYNPGFIFGNNGLDEIIQVIDTHALAKK
jgi:hypothetical protein